MSFSTVKSILLAALCIGAMGIWCAFDEQAKIDRSAHWHITTAKLLASADEIGEGTADSMLVGPWGRVWRAVAWGRFVAGSPTLVYKYKVNGQEFTQARSSYPSLTIVRMAINAESFRPKFETNVSPEEMPRLTMDDINKVGHGDFRPLFLPERQQKEWLAHRPTISVRYNPANPNESEPDPRLMMLYDTLLASGISIVSISALLFVLVCVHEVITDTSKDPMLDLESAIKKQGYYRSGFGSRRFDNQGAGLASTGLAMTLARKSR